MSQTSTLTVTKIQVFNVCWNHNTWQVSRQSKLLSAPQPKKLLNYLCIQIVVCMLTGCLNWSSGVRERKRSTEKAVGYHVFILQQCCMRKEVGFYAHVSAAACINASVCSSQLQKLSSSTAVKSTSWCVCRPVFNAVMTRTLSGYRPILNLCDQDGKNPHRSNLNFRHVALAYQQDSASSDILAENQQERSRRLKVCT